MTNAELSGCVATLGQLINIATGKLDANAASENGKYPFFTCAELPLKIDNHAFDEDAVLLAGNGSFGVSHYKGKFNAYQRTYVITPVIGPTRFYYWLFKAKISAITANNRGSTVKYIRKGDIEDTTVFLPPLAEQKRIAEKLDELLAQVNTLSSRIDSIPQLLKRFRQSVLAAATCGDLTQEWRAQATGLDAETEQAAMKWPWPTVRLGDTAVDFSYGSSAKSQPTGDIPVLRMGNIQRGELTWDDLVFSSNEEEINKYRLHPGDVLFNRTNSPALVGKTAVYKGGRPAIYAGYLIRVKCSEDLAPDFLSACLNSPRGRDYCWRVKTDGVSQSNINAKKLADFTFELPSMAEQTEIVRRVEQLFAFADQLEAKVAAAKTRIDQLTQSILAKAFRGELVPQDPDDEPASVLLERIKAQRVAAPKATRKKKAN